MKSSCQLIEGLLLAGNDVNRKTITDAHSGSIAKAAGFWMEMSETEASDHGKNGLIIARLHGLSQGCYAPPVMRTHTGYITTDDGVRLFYESVGTGQAMLLVPNGPPWIKDFTRFARSRTIVFYDARNRGQSDYLTDRAKLARGVDNDVDDMEAVHRHFGINRVDIFGHSYLGLAVILYAMKYGDHVNRVVQVGTTPPDGAKQYPAELKGADDILSDVLSKLEALRVNPASSDPEQQCRALWSVLRPIYVVDPADVEKLDGWQRCHLETGRP